MLERLLRYQSGRINVEFRVFSRRCPSVPDFLAGSRCRIHFELMRSLRQHPLHDPVAVDENVHQRRRYVNSDHNQQRPFGNLMPAVNAMYS
jgi:hypothetical protein